MRPPRPKTSAGRLLGSRYECKYFISHAAAEQARLAIEPFVKPDAYAAARPGHRYPISSLYLDTDDLALYRQSAEGTKNRFKLRIRSYADDPSSPVFLEIKKRADTVVLKRRAAVARAASADWLHDPHLPRIAAPAAEQAAANEFTSLAHRIRARPTVRVRYSRQAYESTGGDPVRITFDTDVMYAMTPDGKVGLNGAGWHPTPTEGVILEIKFTDRFPSWVGSVVASLQLQKQSIPKYALSVADAVSRRAHGPAAGRSSIFTIAGASARRSRW